MFYLKKILTTAEYKTRKRDKDYRLLLPWNIRRTRGIFNIAHLDTSDIQFHVDLEDLKQ
jgi:hypothetical protein